MTKETADAIVAIGTVFVAIATMAAVFVAWIVYRGQRLLSQRQLLIPLWEYMSAVRNIDAQNPATPQVLNAANTLELVALCVEGGMVDPRVIKRTFANVYLSIYRQILQINAIPGLFGVQGALTGQELLADYRATTSLYQQLSQEEMNRGRLDK